MPASCANGHVNDNTNRFCDQCGLPLRAAPAGPPQEVTFVSMPAAGASSVVCPVCGQENVPGTAFCDNCGAVLPPPQPAAGPSDAAGAAPVAQAQTDSVSVVCPNCGTTNDAANRFCENCGATLASADAASSAPPAAGPPAEGVTIVEDPGVTIVEDEATPAVSVAQGQPESQPQDSAPPMAAQVDSAPAPEAVAGEQASTEQPLFDTVPQPGTEMEAVAVDSVAPEAPVAEAPVAEAGPEAPASGAATVDSGAERARLEAEIDTQRRLVEQLEGMEQSFGAATPPSIRQGLDEARAALSRAEQELADLTGTASATATPAAPVSDAADVPAPDAEAQQPPAEFAPPAVESEPEAAAPSPEPESAATVPEVAAAVPEVAAPPAAPIEAPVVGGSRFVDRDGKVLSLRSGASELVIGREDPVSGIHPDVDLTPHGGESGGVSRRHAVLRDQGGQWTITDLDSTNYTRVDGSRIAPNTPTPLRDGARVQFGRIEFEFRAS